MNCPCCGQSVPEVTHDMLTHFETSPMQARILEWLIKSYPDGLTNQQIIARLYESDPNGGPLVADNVVAVFVWRMRKSLTALGWTIPRGISSKTSKYRLRKLP